MSHARQQIREAVATVVTGLTTTGTNVFQSRVYPMEEASLPGLIVYTTEEEVTEHVGSETIRNLTVVIEGYAKASSDVDDTVDTIAEEVETAIYADTSIGGRCKFGGVVSTEIELTGDSELPVAKATFSFEFMYHVDGTAPGTLL